MIPQELTTEPAAPVKPGYLTTEFAGKCLVQAVALLVLFGVIPADDQAHAQEIALGVLTAVEAAYAYSRGLAKKTPL